MEVELRPLATVRARDNAEVTRLEKTVAERAVAQARRFQAVALGSAAEAKSARRLCGHEKYAAPHFLADFFDQKTPGVSLEYLNVVMDSKGKKSRHVCTLLYLFHGSVDVCTFVKNDRARPGFSQEAPRKESNHPTHRQITLWT